MRASPCVVRVVVVAPTLRRVGVTGIIIPIPIIIITVTVVTVVANNTQRHRDRRALNTSREVTAPAADDDA